MRTDNVLIPTGAVLSLSGFITSPWALALGVTIAVIFGNPYPDIIRRYSGLLMAIAIVGLGASVPLADVVKTGSHGIVYTIAGIACTFAAGHLLSRWMRLEKETACLITVGTAICGGSAIAAISQAIGARPDSTAVSLGTVFLLNALALAVFPLIGHWFALSQDEFGLWAGLAIHDTSSVVGAALHYGDQATQTATMTKLARAIWIIPLAFIVGLSWNKGENKLPLYALIKKCWFIGGFLVMACLANYMQIVGDTAPVIEAGAKRLMVLVLFLVGLGMTREVLRQVGPTPLIYGSALWIVVSLATLVAILLGWITIK